MQYCNMKACDILWGINSHTQSWWYYYISLFNSNVIFLFTHLSKISLKNALSLAMRYLPSSLSF